jgi:hypothetical protein
MKTYAFNKGVEENRQASKQIRKSSRKLPTLRLSKNDPKRRNKLILKEVQEDYYALCITPSQSSDNRHNVSYDFYKAFIFKQNL